MYNTDLPTRAELPSSGKLIRSTLLAAVMAPVLLATVVLPSEYAIDPTGAGRLLGLTEMGEIKLQLAEEAELDRVTTQAAAVEASQTAAPQDTVDTHGDRNGNSISYEKGRGVPEDEGELEAAFTGNHGWFFRNRNDNEVTVVLRIGGDYGELKQLL
ncbi:hypothetical protein [Halomonas sp.]|uniref:hypothetical protein n=1 Tax=Halomonas sp. TaxID=1486246 RepID=UPI003567A1C4